MTATPSAAELVAAAKTGDLVEVTRLIKGGAPLDNPGANGALFEAAYTGHVACATALIEAGADLNLGNGNGSTPLMGAAEQGKLFCVMLLLDRGADRSLKNSHGMAALNYAQASKKKEIEAAFLNLPGEVCYFHTAGDRTLEEIFSFTLKERITYVRKGEDGPVEAFTRESFESLAGTEGLHSAFAEHARRGGQLREEDFDAASLQKPRLARRVP